MLCGLSLKNNCITIPISFLFHFGGNGCSQSFLFFWGGGRSQNGMEKFSILHEMNNKATPTITIFEQ
jgi:hypothetical protein